MQPAIAIPMLLLAIELPPLAASSPQQLVEVLGNAAREGDVEKFVANMSKSTQRALDETEATGKRLQESHKRFEAALDEQFGAGRRVNRAARPAPPDRKAILSRLVRLELASAEEISPNEARLRLRTTSKDRRGRVRTEENAVKALKEGGEWKLEWTEMARVAGHAAAARAAVFERLTEQVRTGSFKDRQSALLALSKAEREGRGNMETHGGKTEAHK